MTPKFAIGQLVQPKDGHKPSAVVSVSITGEGIRYAVAAKSFDADTEEVIEGVRHYEEADLGEPTVEETPAEEAPAEPATPETVSVPVTEVTDSPVVPVDPTAVPSETVEATPAEETPAAEETVPGA